MLDVLVELPTVKLKREQKIPKCIISDAAGIIVHVVGIVMLPKGMNTSFRAQYPPPPLSHEKRRNEIATTILLLLLLIHAAWEATRSSWSTSIRSCSLLAFNNFLRCTDRIQLDRGVLAVKSRSDEASNRRTFSFFSTHTRLHSNDDNAFEISLCAFSFLERPSGVRSDEASFKLAPFFSLLSSTDDFVKPGNKLRSDFAFCNLLLLFAFLKRANPRSVLVFRNRLCLSSSLTNSSTPLGLLLGSY